MRFTLRILLVAAILVASGFVVTHQEPARAQILNSYTCADLNDSRYDGVNSGISASFPTDTWTFQAGDTITVAGEYAGGGSVPTGATITLWINSAPASQTSLPGQIVYTFAGDTVLPPGGDPVLGWEALEPSPNLVETNWDVSCSPAGAATGQPMPGCDLHMRLTPDAAVGAFVADTNIHWAPNVNATTGIIMPAGKTAWVVGIDETGAFYKFIWSCAYLWAPVHTLGPNFDATWNGTPLPVTVVK